jgi:hypothetical protein
MRKLLSFLILSCCVLPLSARNSSGIDGYERRLIPIAVSDLHGAFGSVWSTVVYVVQEGTGRVIIGPDYVGLPIAFGNSLPHVLGPPPTQNEPPGSIFYVPKVAAEGIHISARLLQKGSDPPEEVTIPVVSEDEFVNGTRYFSNFRNSRNERVHLRVYSLDLERPDASVRIRVQADLPAGWTFIHDDEYKLDVKQRYTSLLGPDNLVEQRPLALCFASVGT